MTAGALLLLTLAAGASVLADRPHLVLGADGAAALAVEVPEAAGGREVAFVELTSNVGTVGPLSASGPGRFRASFSPPQTGFPQVALLCAKVAFADGGVELAWLALPLHGRPSLSVKARPGMRIEVEVAGAVFGPAAADSTGTARLPVEVPPGHSAATARSSGGKGPVIKVFELGVAPFERLRLAAAHPGRPSWRDAPVRLEVFAVGADGRPSEVLPQLRASRGALGPLRRLSPGVFAADYLPPEQVGDGVVVLEATSEGQQARLALPVGPGPASRLRLDLSAAEHRAGGDPVVATVTVEDAKGNPAVEPIEVEASLGRALAEGPGRWRLEIPDSFAGAEVAHVRARAGLARGEAALPLRPGPLASASIEPVPRQNPRTFRLRWFDAFGNRLIPRRVEATTTLGAIQAFEGGESAALTLAEGEEGTARLTFRAPEEGVESSLEVAVSNPRRWSLATGLSAVGHTNFARAQGLSPSLRIAGRRWAPPVELALDLGGSAFAALREPFSEAGEGVWKWARVGGAWASFGARYQLRPPFALGLSLGVRRLSGAVRVEGGAADGTEQAISGWAPLFAVSAGMALARGESWRLDADVQASWAPGAGGVAGNLGGLGLGVCWLWFWRDGFFVP